MEKENLNLNDLFTGSMTEKVDKVIKYIQQNSVAISLIFTFAIAFGSVLIKFMTYMMDLGYAFHFGISREILEVSKSNVIYSFFADGVIALVVIMANFIPDAIFKRDMRIRDKILILGGIILGCSLLISAACTIYDICRGAEFELFDFCRAVLSLFVLFLVLFSPAFSLFLTRKYNQKLNNEDNIKEKKNNISLSKKITTSFISGFICVVLSLFFLLVSGCLNASSLNEFKVLKSSPCDDDYAIIYETSDSFIITECIIDEEARTIYIDKLGFKKEIDKKSVEYRIERLKQI